MPDPAPPERASFADFVGRAARASPEPPNTMPAVGDPVAAALAGLSAIYEAANQQVAKVPGASRLASLGKRGSEELHAWSAAPASRDVQKSREMFAKLFDFVVPQDELSALLTAIPPVRGLRMGEHTREVIGTGITTGQILAKKQAIVQAKPHEVVSQRALEWMRSGREQPLTRAEQSGNAFLQYLSRHADDPGRPVLRVYSSGVPDELRGTGAGMAAYMRLTDETLESGIPLVSDTTLSAHSQAIYKALKKRGYTVVENKNTVDMGEGWRHSVDEMPMFQVVAKPMLPAKAGK